MKQIFKLLIIGSLTLATMQSCLFDIEDSRNNYMVDDQLSLVYDEIVTPVSLYAGTHTVSVQKSGKGFDAATVKLGASGAALKAWLDTDEADGAKYKEIPASYYSFSTSDLSFAVEDVRQTLTVSWDPSQLSSLVDGDDYVVPVSILNGSIGVNMSRDLLILNILKSTVSFASTGSAVLAKETAAEDGEVSVKIKVNRVLPKDLTVTMSVDNSLVNVYNTEKGTNYIEAPAGFVVLPSEGATIKAGASDVFANVTLKTSALFGADNQMMNFRTMVVPIRITESSVEGVIIDEKVYYLLVNSPFAGATVSRIWGQYSLDHLWMTDYGLPSGADRNFTTDGNWVYLPYSVGGTVAQITAININDPSDVKYVNTTGFETATITTACVRMIDKGNGSLMLAASGASENKFPFYVWENGIDNPPTVFSLECTWRRGGDRFEFHGTWADGTLYVHSYQGTFTTMYKVKDGAFVSTSRTLVDVPYTGFGGFYNYPGQDQMIFASSDASAFMSFTGTTRKAGDGQDIYEMSVEPFADADRTFGYRVFTYRGDSYIAYTSVDRNDDLKEDGITPYTTVQRARLVIVNDKGGFKASLDGDNKDIVFEAPIQGEEFTNIAIAPPVSIQGDCAVRVYSDKVIIVSGVQGLGISVFKME